MGGALDPVVAAARSVVRAELADLAPGSHVVVGVSGGADSLALAAVVEFVARSAGLQATGIVVDHGLQPGSRGVALRAVAQLEDLGLGARIETVAVGTVGGPEAAARSARLEALTHEGPDAVLLAHTRDDQAETVLLGLGRGSGPRSIAGMRPRSGVLRRPFLRLSRADTEHICTAHDLRWWTDPHNADPAFRRSRLRTEVLPLLEDVLGGGAAAALARTADQVRADNDHLDDLAAAIRTDVAADLADLPPALRTRVLRRAALDAGARPDELSAHHVAELDRLVTAWHGQARVELPGAVSCRRVDGRLEFTPTPARP
ncbi:tRNA lysidine(34) synthetase TilS [Aeromicrobium sp. CF3.5]|uniref:tRNA lysidine(34) synthetase TilS n=1 Tax=Aeromicrobium sp. CF3.5 TaxID=3373078 RepID=UPI003EE7008A